MYLMWKPPTKEGRRMLRLNRRHIRRLPPSDNPNSAGHWMEHVRRWRLISASSPGMPPEWHEDCENHARNCLSLAYWMFLGGPGPAPRKVRSVEEERR